MPGIAIHGGAGTLSKAALTSENEHQYASALRDALIQGHAILSAGGSAVDAVEAAVRSLEDCPLFNAGRGSVFTSEGTIEMDAAIMDGRGPAGAVAGVKRPKNPISVARAVMERSKHVLLIGQGADAFAATQNFDLRDLEYFSVPSRLEQLQQMKAQESSEHVHEFGDVRCEVEQKFGTVGAVALDSTGNLAAATSTGGMSNKRFGRVGDSPLIGCGTYASNSACAISCTGHGEHFIRNVVAHRVACKLEFCAEASLESVASSEISRLLGLGGEGGLIAIDRNGKIAMPYNCEGMYRGFISEDGEPHVFIFENEILL